MAAIPALVSVVMPVYNGERYVAEALRSLAAQTWPRLQFIVVNDGSTDGSEAQILSCGLELEYVAQANAGIASAYETGIARARGEYVAFLEHDDVWLPDKLAREMALFEARPQLGMVYSRYYVADADGRHGPERTSQLELRGDCFGQLLAQTLSGPTILPFSSATVRREVLERIGPLDRSLAISIDYDTWLKIAFSSEIGFVAEPGLLYRQHAGNTSRNGLRAVQDDIRIVERWARRADAVSRAGRRTFRDRLVQAHRDLAWMQAQAGDTGAARASLARAAWLNPGSLWSWSRLAWACVPASMRARLHWYGTKLLPGSRRGDASGAPRQNP
ncbi:hypothetical protein CLD22_00070 [Rubrivivax gelatinosus]|nr:hypothetical protein [Rubrivivax gelatinosus]